MSEKNKILIVDDEQTVLIILEKLLVNNGYDVKCLDSGNKVIETIDEFNADAILLDINLPDTTGFEICKEIRNGFDNADVPIIFISALESLEDRIKGYDLGGDDYIIKPVQHSELLAKLNVLFKNSSKINELKTDYKSAFDTAMQAMTSASELGVIMQFLDTIVTIATFDELIDETLSTGSSLGLDCSLQVRHSNGIISVCNDGEIKPIEAELFDTAKNKGRFYDSGPKTFVNFDNISLLIKNMPTEDQNTYGRIKDYIAPMVNGADARIRAIEAEIELKQKQKILQEAISETNIGIKEANEKLSDLKDLDNKVLSDLINEIDSELFSLALDEENESKIIKIIEEKKGMLLAPHNEGLKIEHIFERIIAKLSEATK